MIGKMVNHYINLTNGIEALTEYNIKNPKYLRIQSTHCEQLNMESIINSASDDFLMNLALGNECVVYDYGSRRESGEPRSIWMGLEFIKFCLTVNWYPGRLYKTEDNFVKCMIPMFIEKYRKLSKQSKKRLKYYRKFLNTDIINLKSVTTRTVLDGQYDVYSQILKEKNK